MHLSKLGNLSFAQYNIFEVANPIIYLRIVRSNMGAEHQCSACAIILKLTSQNKSRYQLHLTTLTRQEAWSILDNQVVAVRCTYFQQVRWSDTYMHEL
ncbi:unnamed protein product [Fusarium graminearum]|uniref:Uncharacterized protein n=1 Tax=Gibberella zeae TaxID=5518 RepID=A0A9N8NAJ4_GIBZA|nr:unnamed protein product [Fusarium graminearum]